eukprot:TRINITY_DN3613_c0_g2_i4.p1 TRINITY_DN3613_c0_g2~~TRINITY_DN3613_c0_g2_i4.p1  ORF type:complete len:1020 (+),score=-39.04 TRINITY_DN3613_c0_g2_i4:207-3266(+)
MAAAHITGEELRALLNKKRAKPSCAPDAITWGELKSLPMPMLDALATIFNKVEQCGKWPQAVTDAQVSWIPKEGPASPLNNRPITVTSCIYRLWGGVRLIQILKWQETWAHPDQFGFRSGRTCEDLVFDVWEALESALTGDGNLWGVALDYSKCFDLVPQQIAFEVLKRLGMDGGVLRAMQGMYCQIRRRHKFQTGVGKEFTTTNGILQGCAMSIIAINALMAILMKDMEREVTGAFSKGYADDITILSSVSEERIQRALDRVAAFCDVTGQALNVKKTFAFGTEADYRTTLTYDGGVLPQRATIKLLGMYADINGKVTVKRDDKIESAVMELRRLRLLNFLPPKQKALFITSVIIPKALHGTTFSRPPEYLLKKLRGAISRTTMGVCMGKQPSPEAVTSIINKGHLIDPLLHIEFKAFKQMMWLIQRRPAAAESYNRVLKWYLRNTSQAARGPLGLLLKHTMPKAGIKFGASIQQIVQIGGPGTLDLSTMTKSQFGGVAHVVRSQLLAAYLAHLTDRHPSFDGVLLGFAKVETNRLHYGATKHTALAKAIREVITGAVETSESRVDRIARAQKAEARRNGTGELCTNADPKNGSAAGFSTSLASPCGSTTASSDSTPSGDSTPGTSTVPSSEAASTSTSSGSSSSSSSSSQGTPVPVPVSAEPPLQRLGAQADHLCPLCDTGEADTLSHQWWACPFTADCRVHTTQAQKLSAMDRSGWPRCLTEHGIIPTALPSGTTMDDMYALQALVGQQHLLRTRALAQARRPDRPANFPWRGLSHAQAPKPLKLTPGNKVPRWWHLSPGTFFAYLDWMAHLTWRQGQVTNIELAVDFCAYTGRSPDGLQLSTETSLGIGPLARLMRTTIGVLLRHSQGTYWRMDDAFPPRPVPRAGSLRGITGSTAIGYDMRPTFASERTAHILENILLKAAVHADWRHTFKVHREPGSPARWPRYRVLAREHNWVRKPRPKRKRKATRQVANTTLQPRRKITSQTTPTSNQQYHPRQASRLTPAPHHRKAGPPT